MDTIEWVEIIEPDSHKTVYANPSTGEMKFEPPDGVPFKPMTENQWWELFDPSSNANYYYNPHTGDTVWEQPESADIIPLMLLQSCNTTGEETVDAPTQQNHEETHLPNQTETSLERGSKPEQLPYSGVENNDAFSQPLETLSPFTVDFNEHRFSKFESDVEAAERKSSLVTSPDTNGTNPIITDVDSLDLIQQTDDNSQNTPIIHEEPPLQRRTSLPKHRNETRPVSDTTNTVSQEERERLESFLILSVSDVQNTGNLAVPVSPRRVRSEKSKSKGTTIHSGYSTIDGGALGKSKSHKRKLSQGIPPAPTPPVVPGLHTTKMSRSVSLQIEPGKSLDRFGELEQHKRGFFRKKVTIANMLSWTKDPIKRPMILQRDKELRKECIDLFKLVLQYMGDRKSKQKGKDELALHIASKCWEKKGLRDEIYIQLCRQTTGNSKAESLQRGWDLFTVCLAMFPPTVKFRSYLEGYLWKHVEPSPENLGVPVEVYAQYCHKRVEKMTQSGAKKGLKKPTLEEIKHAKNAPFNPSVFGMLLEEVMMFQEEKHPDLDLPWMVIELCETVLKLRGPYTQGIFRIPGDIDAVNALKLHLDKGYPVPDTTDDPHVPASLLKLWFRELEDPLIPENYYDTCINNCDHVNNAISLVHSLPEINKKVLFYIINFLQKFTSSESSEHTRMGLDNIAMVWAPNFLRCPSDDHVMIFENTRKEMAFVRLLLKFLNPNDEK